MRYALIYRLSIYTILTVSKCFYRKSYNPSINHGNRRFLFNSISLILVTLSKSNGFLKIVSVSKTKRAPYERPQFTENNGAICESQTHDLSITNRTDAGNYHIFWYQKFLISFHNSN